MARPRSLPPEWELIAGDVANYNPHAYQPDAFYTGSTDGKGHKDQLNLKLPPLILGRLRALVESGQVPAYTTVQAFIRDGIVHRLHQIGTLLENDELVAEANLQAALAHAEQRRERREVATRYLEEVKTEIRALRDEGDRHGLTEYAEDTRRALPLMPEGIRKQLKDLLDTIT